MRLSCTACGTLGHRHDRLDNTWRALPVLLLANVVRTAGTAFVILRSLMADIWDTLGYQSTFVLSCPSLRPGEARRRLHGQAKRHAGGLSSCVRYLIKPESLASSPPLPLLLRAGLWPLPLL